MLPFATVWLDLENSLRLMKTQKEKHHINITYMWNLNNTNECVCKIETDSQMQKKNACGYKKGEWGGEENEINQKQTTMVGN